MTTHYRHGDLLLIRIAGGLKHAKRISPFKYNAPLKYTPRDSGVILTGETTGHAHRIAVKDFVNKKARILDEFEQIINSGIEVPVKKRTLIVVTKPTKITHEEHNTITLPRGTYEVRRQKEYDEEQDYYVRD